MDVKLQRKLLNTEAYHLMMQVGIFSEDDRVELLNGEIIEMSPIGSSHAAHVKRIRTILGDLLGKDVILGVQDPVVLNEYSEPEPDISVLRPDPEYYASRHPEPQDIILLIEVSDSSLQIDREVKSQLYAKAGIPIYWIVNLIDEQIEIYSQPDEGFYKSRQIATKKDKIPLEPFALQVTGEDIL